MNVARIAAAVALLASACDTGDDEPSFGDVVLIIAGSATLDPGDAAVESRLGSLMYETRVIDEPSLTSEDVEAEDVGFILVTASVSSSATLEAVDDTRKAVIVSQVYVADDFGISESDAKIRELNVATAAPEDSLATWTIEDTDHPAVGMASPGPFEVWGDDGFNVLPMITPPESAAVIASYPGGYATVVAYDRGNVLADGETKSPGRRALFAHEPRAPTIFTSDGWDLFESVVAWAFPL